MFGKKKQAASMHNEWTREYKLRWNAAHDAKKKLQIQVGATEAAIKCAQLLPDSDLKKQAEEHIIVEQNQLITYANNYRKAITAIESYYALYWQDIEVDWRPEQWDTEYKVIYDTYRRNHQLFYYEF